MVWDENVKEFTTVARDVTRKRSEKFIPIKINNAHQKLQERVVFLGEFRRQHESLLDTVMMVLKPDERSSSGMSISVNSVEEINKAFDFVKGLDVLDVSTGMARSGFFACR